MADVLTDHITPSMIDWTASMERTFEFYEVDPVSWKDMRLLTNVKTCTINWDSEAETLGSATFDVTESVGECYIRIYMIVIQNGYKHKLPMGTFLVQTPSSGFNGKIRNVVMDAYTPLIELKEKIPPFGFFVEANANIMEKAASLTRQNCRAIVIPCSSDKTLYDDEVADPNDTWASYLTTLIASDKHNFTVDEMGRIGFAPDQEVESLQPVWTYDDGNSSILCADLDLDHDLYGVPNVVEVLYSNNKGSWHKIAKNEDPASPTSIPSRGRQIMYRITDPDFHDISDAPEGSELNTEEELQKYADAMLKKLSTIEYTVSYTHGYCPVRVGDCVRINYERAGLVGIKAKVISQSIKCTPGCLVSEKAVFTMKLWR